MNNLSLAVVAHKKQLTQLRQLAEIIFPYTYRSILSSSQIAYMMEQMYREEVLLAQIDAGVSYYLLLHGRNPIGYLALEKGFKQANQLYIHKIYILPIFQTHGYGGWMLAQVESMALQDNLDAIGLNVNRHNKAKAFYVKHGFRVCREEDIAIGQGFYMQDYYMTKLLK